jgi:hypothetical protein
VSIGGLTGGGAGLTGDAGLTGGGGLAAVPG